MHRILTVGATLVTVGAVAVSAQQTAGSTKPAGDTVKAATHAAVHRGDTPSILLGTQESAFAIVQGTAVTDTGSILPNVLVRLRDARTGRIVDSKITDNAGLFTFRAVDPGSYVVELVANDRTVLDASPILNPNAGEKVSAVVRLPSHTPAVLALLGKSVPQAAAIISAAAAAGVLAVDAATSTPVRDISPQ